MPRFEDNLSCTRTKYFFVKQSFPFRCVVCCVVCSVQALLLYVCHLNADVRLFKRRVCIRDGSSGSIDDESQEQFLRREFECWNDTFIQMFDRRIEVVWPLLCEVLRSRIVLIVLSQLRTA